jgi:hypothetical protein
MKAFQPSVSFRRAVVRLPLVLLNPLIINERFKDVVEIFCDLTQS